MKRIAILLVVLAPLLINPVYSQGRNDSFFKNGDRINFIGNSITHGTANTGRFHNFILLYYATRFPNSKVVFYNSGKWGDNANSFIQRMDYDILSKPAEWSVVMAGMNDVNRSLYDPAVQSQPDIETRKQRALSDYRGYLRTVVQKLLAANTKVILQKPSIYDQTGSLSGPNMPGVNDALQKCTEIIDELATEFNLRTVDYWTIMSTINQQLQQENPAATVVSSDRIHPASPGNLLMAYQFLKSTNAPKYVANVEIAGDKLIKNEYCTITGFSAQSHTVEFKYKAESLPFPVAADAESALSLVPFSSDLNAEMLKISSLNPGRYALNIDGSFIANFTSDELSQGINLALLKNTPQYLQALNVKGKTDAYRDLQVKIRDLKFIEINYLAKELWTDFSAAQTYIQNLKNTNANIYTNQRNRFDAYLTNKPIETEIEQNLVTLADEIFAVNKPVERAFNISLTTQTHSWDFNQPVSGNKVEGWTIYNYSGAHTSNGILHLTSTDQIYCNIRYFVPAGEVLDTELSKIAVVRLKNSTPTTKGRFYWWGSNANAAYIEFDISGNDTDFKEYSIDLSADSRWSGNIASIRFDLPFPYFPATYGMPLDIDYIKLKALPPMPSQTPAPFGVNLAGAEFGEIPGNDYSYPTVAELDYFKTKGLTLFRLPFKWERIQPILNGDLDATELSKMKTFVQAARARGLWVILDMHNYGRRKIGGVEYLIGSPEVSIANVSTAWGKLAEQFKDYENVWAYGIMNEPHDMLASAPWLTIAQQIINQIRTVDLTTTIMVGGDSWSSAARWLTASDNLKTLDDPSDKLVFESHVYFDDDAGGKYDQSYDGEKATPSTGINRVTPFVNWLKSNNLQGFVGEYGVPDTDFRWLTVLENMLSYLKSNHVNGTYWAAGPRWGTYALSVEPRSGLDRPQMEVLEKYLYADIADGTLPVTLLSFTGKYKSNSVTLNWNTASENNNSHFDILRSREGLPFSPIGRITGRNLSALNAYSFTDQNPLMGTTYYQLNQTDYDGKTTSFPSIAVTVPFTNDNFQMSVHNNRTIKLSVNTSQGALFDLVLTDLRGRVIKRYSKNLLRAGENSFEFASGVTIPGVYMISFLSDAEKRVAKVYIY